MKMQLITKGLSKQAGMSLISLMVAVTIGAMLALVAGKAAFDAYTDTKPDQMSNDISYISQKMVKCGAYKGGNYSTCDFDELVRLDLLKEEQWGDGSGVNPYGGDYSTGAVTGNTNQFYINATGVPSTGHCNRLIEMYTGYANTVTCASGTLNVTQG